ncbi:helix-turn-helix transcriptional regulator [Verrucomicrobiaceae bacterium N1E253]|uniref:Helix-turn-helix transcriptional regulator n=1 Tax=Oceaniferula marina TaxID=2748318 RepID=A0A851GJI9_9BACT|nr:AraC family transcriptional regulator [Oceaniferula marina]NWK54840.1 helix-turn-helix transcriptional regulator [Oceaniferula marina]
MEKEIIPSNLSQSFRFFSWKDSLENVVQHVGQGDSISVSGMGNVWHYHPEVELTFFTEGEGFRYIGDDICAFEAPQLVLLGSNLPHHWTVKRSSGFCIQFPFDAVSPLANLHESIYFRDLLQEANRGLVFSRECRDEVFLLLQHCVQCDDLERLVRFFQIMKTLCDAPAESISSSEPQAISKSHSAMMKKAVQYIVENATQEEMTIQRVLSYVGMSRATFSRHFQRAVGQNYTQFVHSIRLVTARNMLINTDDPITQIAYASGFSNISHFNRLFKERWSMTPRALRLLTREADLLV